MTLLTKLWQSVRQTNIGTDFAVEDLQSYNLSSYQINFRFCWFLDWEVWDTEFCEVWLKIKIQLYYPGKEELLEVIYFKITYKRTSSTLKRFYQHPKVVVSILGAELLYNSACHNVTVPRNFNFRVF